MFRMPTLQNAAYFHDKTGRAGFSQAGNYNRSIRTKFGGIVAVIQSKLEVLMVLQEITTQAIETVSSPIPQVEKLITGAELAAMDDMGLCELEEGRIVTMNPVKRQHSKVAMRLARYLGDFVDEQFLGEVHGGEIGIYTHRNPDSIRAADVAFISSNRAEKLLDEGFLDVAPELVVEVLSPNDRWGNVKKKLREYFDIGVIVVLVVDPDECTISLYRSLTHIAELGVGDTLELPDVLPGFQLPLAKLFA